MSSPVARAPVSVLSPNIPRCLDTSVVPRSASPAPRIAVCRGTSTRDEVQFVDASIDACVSSVDKSVQAVVGLSDVSTVYDPPAEAPLSASQPTAVVSELMETAAVQPVLPSAGTMDTLIDVPEDFSVDVSPVAEPVLEAASESDPGETSPMAPLLLESDDEPIASRLPGYLNRLKTCEIIDRQFISFLFHLHKQFRSSRFFHLFSIFLVPFVTWFCKFSFFIIF